MNYFSTSFHHCQNGSSYLVECALKGPLVFTDQCFSSRIHFINRLPISFVYSHSFSCIYKRIRIFFVTLPQRRILVIFWQLSVVCCDMVNSLSSIIFAFSIAFSIIFNKIYRKTSFWIHFQLKIDVKRPFGLFDQAGPYFTICHFETKTDVNDTKTVHHVRKDHFQVY